MTKNADLSLKNKQTDMLMIWMCRICGPEKGLVIRGSQQNFRKGLWSNKNRDLFRWGKGGSKLCMACGDRLIKIPKGDLLIWKETGQ